jgi:hypothetical protein
VLLIPVAVVLMLALAAWFAELGLRSSLAHFCAGLVGLVVVAILGLFGKSKVTPSNLALTHTKDEMARDADAGKSAI